MAGRRAGAVSSSLPPGSRRLLAAWAVETSNLFWTGAGAAKGRSAATDVD